MQGVKKIKMVLVSLRLDSADYEVIKERAKEMGVSASAFIRIVLRQQIYKNGGLVSE
jgi:predicted DNA binding CopG/RHH family protein